MELAATSPIMVLTGGPGTGKTTTVRGILALFDKLNLRTVLCAPTGRAAKRMSELTNRDATTIHRLLGASYSAGDQLVFERDETNPLSADAVICRRDFHGGYSAYEINPFCIKPHCRLILVGDADQLPSVGPGNVFFRYYTERDCKDGKAYRDFSSGKGKPNCKKCAFNQ